MTTEAGVLVETASESRLGGALTVAAGGVVGEFALFLEDLLDAIPEPTALTLGRRVLHVNRAFTELFEYSLIECVGDDIADILVPDGLRHEVEMIEHQLRLTGRVELETTRRSRSGVEIAVQVVIARLRLSAQSQGHFVSYRDIRRQKQEEARLRFTALHDGLTGLSNRVLFLNRLELTMARLRRRPDRGFSIYFIDLDGFKQVNDRLGHAAGDELLMVVSERLKRCVRPQDTVARFGGDEFALLLDDIAGAGDVASVAERLQTEIGVPIPVEGGEGRVTASVGVAIASLRYGSAEEMLRDADHAMYDAKMAGKARYRVFGAKG